MISFGAYLHPDSKRNKKIDNQRILQKLFSHKIKVQYYNVLCAKCHLKIIYKSKYNTVCAESSIQQKLRLKKAHGTKPSKLDDYTPLHSTVTIFLMTCYTDT
jgi:hypothetical protein